MEKPCYFIFSTFEINFRIVATLKFNMFVGFSAIHQGEGEPLGSENEK